MITYAQLTTLRTAPIASAADDYRAAGRRLRSAGTSYQEHVVTPIDGRRVWRGSGRSHAETVLRVQRLAFSTASARLRTVATCLDVLEGELAAAKRSLDATVTAARASFYHVDEHGNVTKDPVLHVGGPNPQNGGIDWYSERSTGQAARYAERIKLHVRRARRADTACKKLLETIIAADFVTTSTAQPGILDQAREANATARDAEIFAHLLADILHAAHRRDATATDDKEYGAVDTSFGFAKGFWEGATDLLGLLMLLGFAAAGDPRAGETLKSIPAAARKQLSTLDGWKDLINWKDLEEQRPGEFAGNLLFSLILGKIRLPHLRVGRHKARSIRATEDDEDLMHIADRIADHAAYKGHEIPGIPDDQVPDYVFKTMRESDGRVLRDTPSGQKRIAWWDPERKVLVIREGDKGSIYPPGKAEQYLRDLMWE